MPLYKYVSNISQTDRFDQIRMQKDNGTIIDLMMGRTYDLTLNEYQRASRSIVLVLSGESPSVPSQGNSAFNVVGELHGGDVPVWNSQLGAFVPGSGGSTVVTEADESELNPSDHSEGTLWIRVVD